MSKQDKLMNDEELLKEIYQITQDMLVALSEWQAGVPLDYNTEKVKGRSKILDLINTQKRLYAESVIGEDLVYTRAEADGRTEDLNINIRYYQKSAVNNRLAEQRARIK